jgi:hypothetical protein
MVKNNFIIELICQQKFQIINGLGITGNGSAWRCGGI